MGYYGGSEIGKIKLSEKKKDELLYNEHFKVNLKYRTVEYIFWPVYKMS